MIPWEQVAWEGQAEWADNDEGDSGHCVLERRGAGPASGRGARGARGVQDDRDDLEAPLASCPGVRGDPYGEALLASPSRVWESSPEGG